MLKFLRGDKGKANSLDELQNTPLMYALQVGNLEAINALINQEGIDFAKENLDGYT